MQCIIVLGSRKYVVYYICSWNLQLNYDFFDIINLKKIVFSLKIIPQIIKKKTIHVPGSFVSSGLVPSIGGVVVSNCEDTKIDAVGERRIVDSKRSDDVVWSIVMEDRTADLVDTNGTVDS